MQESQGHCHAATTLQKPWLRSARRWQALPHREPVRLGAEGYLDRECLTAFISNPDATSERAVNTTHGPGNHAVRSQHWRYIRYTDGSEELYDHTMDPDEFTNLAEHAKFRTIKASLATHIPATDASLTPQLAVRQQKQQPPKAPK